MEIFSAPPLVRALKRSRRGIAIFAFAAVGISAVGLTAFPPAPASAAASVATSAAPIALSGTPPGPISTAVASTPAEPRPTSTPKITAPKTTPSATATAIPNAGLSVSTPDGTLTAPRGTTVETWLRIGNAAGTPLSITIAPATVNLKNNGVTGFTPKPDPRFAGRITLSQTSAIIPVGGYIQLDVKVAIPATIIPDVYVLGFLITPEATGTSVRIVNQIGSLIAFDVPGSRDRQLKAVFTDLPWIMFTNHPSLNIRTRSVGKSALQFTSQDNVSGFGMLDPKLTRNDPLLLPAGTSRDLTVSWDTPWGVGVNTISTTLLYPKTVSANAQVVLTHQVIVVKPLLAMIVGGVLLLIILTITSVILLRRRDAPLRRNTWEPIATRLQVQ